MSAHDARTNELIVGADEGGMRLDKYLSAQLPDLSRSFAQALIAAGHVRVEGTARKANYAVKPGERIQVAIPPPEPTTAHAQAIPLDILFEDETLLVIDKPAGMVVHPGAGHVAGTLVNAVLGHAPDIVTGNAERPGIVHRLDRDTSGVLVVAKTDAALHELTRQFSSREVHKTYLALVQGVVKTPVAEIDAPLARDPRDRKKIAISSAPNARAAVTRYRVLAQTEKYTLLRVEPETGRTHQIRVHLAFIKHPVVADAVYGKSKNDLGLKRQFLHAWRIRFKHPTTTQVLEFEAPLPTDLTEALVRAQIDARTVLG